MATGAKVANKQMHGGDGLVKGWEGQNMHKSKLDPNVFTRATGCPVAHLKNSLTAGPTGPVLLQDVTLIEKIQHFTRERTPPRNVHALGTGCYGELEITNPEISKLSTAKVFTMGKKTPLFTRFSGVFTEFGEAETVRDPRGFALKFYTEEGNWDLLAINTPVFNARDGKVGPDAVHAFKRDPRTHEWNPNQVWDFVVNHPEGLHQVLMVFSDAFGTPMSYRRMHAWGCNTFSFYTQNTRTWVKFHLISQQGPFVGFNQHDAKLVAGEDPTFLTRDLREAIDKGNYPTWKFCCQIMNEDEGYSKPWAFDCTKSWSLTDFPLIDIGIVRLTHNPINYLAEVEQVAFSPANVPPGIGFSPDKLLQARLFIYDDAQYHRLGANFKQIPINRPNQVEPQTPYISSAHNHEVRDKWPHYYPSTFGGLRPAETYREPPLKNLGVIGDCFDLPHEGTDEDYFAQPRAYYTTFLTDADRIALSSNLATSLAKVVDAVALPAIAILGKMDPGLATSVQNERTAIRTATAKKSVTEAVWEAARMALGHSVHPETAAVNKF